LSEFITALIVLTIPFLIIKDGRFIFLFSAGAICAVFAFLALKFPTVPLYLLIICGLTANLFYENYDFSWGGERTILLTDPVYVIIGLTMVLAVFRDPGVVTAYWNYLRGGIFLFFAFFHIDNSWL